MTVYMHNAAFFCEACGRDLPAEPDTGGPHDSDEYAIAYADAGETDSPCHCDRCGELLECSLTDEGRDYVRAALEDGSGDPATLAAWREAFTV